MAGPRLAKRSADETQIAQIAAQTAVRHGEQRVGPAVSPELMAQNRAGQAMAQSQRLLEGGQRVRNFLNETGMQTPNMQANQMLGEMSRLSERTRTIPAGTPEAERQRLLAINQAAKNAGAALCGSPPDLQLATSLYRRALALEQLNGQIGIAGGSRSTQPAQAVYASAFQAVREGDTARASSLMGVADLRIRTRNADEGARALTLGRMIMSGDPSRRAMAERELQARIGVHNLEKGGPAQEETRKALRLAAGFYERGLHNEGLLTHRLAEGFHNAAQLVGERRDKISDSLRVIRSRFEELDRCRREGKTLMQLRGAEGQDAQAFWQREHLEAAVHLAAVEIVAYEQRLFNAMNALGLSMQSAIATMAMDLIKSTQGKLKEMFKEEEVRLLKKAAEEIIDCLTEEGKLRKLGKKKAAELFRTAAEKFAKVKEAGKGKIAAAMAEAEKALITALKMGKAEESVKDREAARKKYISKLTRMEAALTALAKKLGGVTDSKGKKIFDELEFRRMIRAVRLAVEKSKTKAEMDKWMGGLSGLRNAIDLVTRRAERVLILQGMAREIGEMLRIAKGYEGRFESLRRSYSSIMDNEMTKAFRRAFMGLKTLMNGRMEAESEIPGLRIIGLLATHEKRLLSLEGLQKTILSILGKAREGTLDERQMDSAASRFKGAKLNFKAQMNGIALQFFALKEALGSKLWAKQGEKKSFLKIGMEESAKHFMRAAALAHDHAILTGERGREFSEADMKKMSIIGRFNGRILFLHDGKLYAVVESKDRIGKGKKGKPVTKYLTEYTFYEDLSAYKKGRDLLDIAKEVIKRGITSRVDLLSEARNEVKAGFLARGRSMPNRAFTLVAQEQVEEWERSMHGKGSENFSAQLDRTMSMLVRAELVLDSKRGEQFFNKVARSMDLLLAGRRLIRADRELFDTNISLGKLENKKESLLEASINHHYRASMIKNAKKKAMLKKKADKVDNQRAAVEKKIEDKKEARKKLLAEIEAGKLAWRENTIPEPGQLVGSPIGGTPDRPRYSRSLMTDMIEYGEQTIARDEQAEKVLQAMKGIALLATSFIHGGAGLAAWGADLAYNIYKTGDVHAKEIVPFALSVATHGASSYVAAMMKARGAVAGEAGAEALLRSPWQVSSVKVLAAANSGVGLAIGMEGAVDAMGQMRPGMDTADWVSALNAIVQGFGLPVAHSVQGQRRMARAALLENKESLRGYVNALTMEQIYAREGAKTWETAKSLGFEGSKAEFNDALRAHHNAKIVRKYSAYPEAKFAEANLLAQTEGYSGNAEQFKIDLQRRRALEKAFRIEDPAANAAANEKAARAALAQPAAQTTAAPKAEAVTKVEHISVTPPAPHEKATRAVTAAPGEKARPGEAATSAELAGERTPPGWEKATPKAEEATAAARKALGEEKTKAERASGRVTPPAGPERATPVVTPGIGEEATAPGGRAAREGTARPNIAEDRTSPLRKLTPEEVFSRDLSRDLSGAKASLDIAKNSEQAAFDRLAGMVHPEKEPKVLPWRKRAWEQRRAKAVEAAVNAARAKLDAGVSPKDLSPAEAAASMLIDARNEAGSAQKAYDSHPGHQRTAERQGLHGASYEKASERVSQLDIQAKIHEMDLVKKLNLKERSETEQRSAIDAAVKSALAKKPEQLTSADIRALELAGVRERLRIAKDVQASELGKRAEQNRIAAPMDAEALRSGEGSKEMLARRGAKFGQEDLAADFSKAQGERGPLGTEEARAAVYRGMGIEVGGKALQDSSLFDMLMRGNIEGKLNSVLGISGARISRIRQLAGLKGAYELTLQTPSGEMKFYAKTNSFVADAFGARVARAVGLKTPPIYAVDPRSGKPYSFISRSGKEVQYGFMNDIRKFGSAAGEAAPARMENTSMMRDIIERSTPEAKAAADALADPKMRREFYRALGEYMERTRWAGLGDRFPRNTAVTFKNGKFEFHPIDLDSGGIVMALRDARGKFNDRNMRADYGEAVAMFADYIAKAQPHLETSAIVREMREGFLEGAAGANRELRGRRQQIAAEMHRLMDGHNGKPHGVSFSEESGIKPGDRVKRNFNGEQPIVSPEGRVIYDSGKAKDAFNFNIGQREGKVWKNVLERAERHSQAERIAGLKEKGLQALKDAEFSAMERFRDSLTPEALVELEKGGNRATRDAAAAYRANLEALKRIRSEAESGAPAKDLQLRERAGAIRERVLFASLLDAIQKDKGLAAKAGEARSLQESAQKLRIAHEDLAIAVRGQVKEPLWRIFARELVRPPEAGVMRAEAGPEALIVRRLIDAAKAVRDELILRKKAAAKASDPDVAWLSRRFQSWARKNGVSLPKDAGEGLARMALESGLDRDRIIEVVKESKSAFELFNSMKKDMLWELAGSAPEKAFAEQELAISQLAEATRNAKEAADRAAGRPLGDAELKAMAQTANGKPVSARTELENLVLELDARSRELAAAQHDLDTLRVHGLAQKESRVPTPAEKVAISNEAAVALALSKDARYSAAIKNRDTKMAQALAEQYAHLRNVVENTRTTVREGRFVDVVKDARQVIAFGDRHADFRGTVDQMLRTGILVETNLPGGKGYKLNSDLPKGTQIVFAGDYIDRGPGGMQVVDLVRSMKEQAKSLGVSVHVLRGNHEALFLKFIERHGNKTTDQIRALFKDTNAIFKAIADDGVNWSRIGMNETFESILRKYNTADWQAAMSRMKQDGTLDFFNSMKGAAVIDGNMFTHGGPVLKPVGELDAHFASLFGKADNHWSNTELQLPEANALIRKALSDGDFSSMYIGQGWYKDANFENWMKKEGLKHIYVGHDPAMKSVHMFSRLATGIDAGLFQGYGGNSQVPIIDPLRADMPIRLVKGRESQPTTVENFAQGRSRTDVSAGTLAELAQRLYDRGEAIAPLAAPPVPAKKAVTPEKGAAVKGEIVRLSVSDSEFVQRATDLERAKAGYKRQGGDPENVKQLLNDAYDAIENTKPTPKMEAALELERASRFYEEARASREGLKKPPEPAPKEAPASLEDALLAAEQKVRGLDAQYDKLSPGIRHAALRDIEAMRKGRFRGEVNQYHKLIMERQKATAELNDLRQKTVAERQRAKADAQAAAQKGIEKTHQVVEEARKLGEMYLKYESGIVPTEPVELYAMRYIEERTRAGAKPEDAARAAAELSILSKEANPSFVDPSSLTPELANALANHRSRVRELMWRFPEAFRTAETITYPDGTTVRIGSPLRMKEEIAVPVYITQEGRTQMVFVYPSESQASLRRFPGEQSGAIFKGKFSPKLPDGVAYLGEHFQNQEYRIQKAVDKIIKEKAPVDTQSGGERVSLFELGFNGKPKKGDPDAPGADAPGMSRFDANRHIVIKGEQDLQISMNAEAEKVDVSAPGNRPAKMVDYWFAGSDSAPYGKHIKAVVSSENGKYLYGVVITEDGMFLSYLQHAEAGINRGGSPKKGLLPKDEWLMTPIIEYEGQVIKIDAPLGVMVGKKTIVGTRGGRLRLFGAHETPKSPFFELNNGLSPLFRMLREGNFNAAESAMSGFASGKTPLTSAEKPKTLPFEALKNAIEKRTDILAKAFEAYEAGRLDPSTPAGRAMMEEMKLSDRDIDIFRRWKEATEESRMVRLGRRAAQWAKDEAAAGRLKPEAVGEPTLAMKPEAELAAKAGQDIEGIRKRASEKGLDPQDVLARMVRIARSEKAAGRDLEMAGIESMAVAEAIAAKAAEKPIKLQFKDEANNPGPPELERLLPARVDDRTAAIRMLARQLFRDVHMGREALPMYRDALARLGKQPAYKEIVKLAAEFVDRSTPPPPTVGSATVYDIRRGSAEDAGIAWTPEMDARLLVRSFEIGVHESLVFDAYLEYKKGRKEASLDGFIDALKFAGNENESSPQRRGEVKAAREALNESKRQWDIDEGLAEQTARSEAAPETVKKKFIQKVREWLGRRRELRKAEADDFLRRYGVPLNEAGLIGGGPPSPQLQAFKERQNQAKNAGFVWTNENNTDLSFYAKKRGQEENVLFEAYRGFRKMMGNEYWGTPEDGKFKDFARALDPAYKPTSGERRVKLKEKARDALDNALKSASAKAAAKGAPGEQKAAGAAGAKGIPRELLERFEKEGVASIVRSNPPKEAMEFIGLYFNETEVKIAMSLYHRECAEHFIENKGFFKEILDESAKAIKEKGLGAGTESFGTRGYDKDAAMLIIARIPVLRNAVIDHATVQKLGDPKVIPVSDRVIVSAEAADRMATGEYRALWDDLLPKVIQLVKELDNLKPGQSVRTISGKVGGLYFEPNGVMSVRGREGARAIVDFKDGKTRVLYFGRHGYASSISDYDRVMDTITVRGEPYREKLLEGARDSLTKAVRRMAENDAADALAAGGPS